MKTIVANERRNVDLRVSCERSSKMAELFGEHLENLNKLKTKAEKVHFNPLVELCTATIEQIVVWRCNLRIFD